MVGAAARAHPGVPDERAGADHRRDRGEELFLQHERVHRLSGEAIYQNQNLNRYNW